MIGSRRGRQLSFERPAAECFQCGSLCVPTIHRSMKTINVVSGIGAIVFYTYGVIDGIRHYRKRSALLRVE